MSPTYSMDDLKKIVMNLCPILIFFITSFSWANYYIFVEPSRNQCILSNSNNQILVKKKNRDATKKLQLFTLTIPQNTTNKCCEKILKITKEIPSIQHQYF